MKEEGASVKIRRNVALILGGGAARGFAHIGVLKVLRREKIPVDLVVGTSIGALIGAGFALDISTEKMEEQARKIRWRDLLDLSLSRLGLIEGTRLEHVIREAIEHKTFHDLKIPLGVVACDVEKPEEMILTSGDLAKSIRASCSLAGIFAPVRVGGRLLIDGGVVQTVPVSAARKLGARFTIAVDVGFMVRVGKIDNVFQLIYQSYQIMAQELSNYQAYAASVTIKPDLGDIHQMAFNRAEEAIRIGELAAEKALPEIREKLRLPAAPAEAAE